MQARSLLILCWLLGIALLVAVWIYISPTAINVLFSLGENIAILFARMFEYVVDARPGHIQAIIVSKFNGGRSIILGLVAVILMMIILRSFGKSPWPAFKSALLTLTVVHLILGFFWIRSTLTMEVIHEAHRDWLRGIFRSRGWGQLETWMTQIFHVQNLLVMGEALALYLFIGWLFGHMRGRHTHNKPA